MRTLLRHTALVITVVGLAVTLTLSATAFFGGSPSAEDGSPARPAGGQAPSVDQVALLDPTDLIGSLQARLQRTPRDHRAWSTLAMAYVEQARVSADPSYYARADKALSRAGHLAPPEDSVLLTARATLTAARHDFSGALRSGTAALRSNPYSAAAEAIRADALTELGRYSAAQRAARRADELDPGPATFARLSYQAELRGDLAGATRLMRLAQRASGTSAPAYAFATFHLGELARATGQPRRAAHHYRNALEADPTHLPAVAGLARLAVARGDLASAERDYLRVVRGLPLIEYNVELGELYEATGRPDLAAEQYAVASAAARLEAANGVAVDREIALIEADHGSPRAALQAARAEWDRRRSIFSADALAWALHVNGRDGEALAYARLATRLGTQDPRLLFHRGAIEHALGLPAATGHLRAALRLDSGASPWRAEAIRVLLASAR